MNKQKISIITLAAIILTMVPSTVTHAQMVQDSAICYDYGTDLKPNGVGNTIFQYTEKIGLWVQIQDPADVSYRMIWEDPSGSQFRNQAVEVVEKSGEDWGIVFDSIKIAETTARTKLGVWTVSLYIDGELATEAEFQILDYEEFVENIQTIQTRIQEIVDEKDDLLAQNQELRTQLESLQADYAALEAQVGTSSDYEELQDNYDELQEDYESLKTSQATTKMMLYASIVVALVAVVVAVYFGALKK
jgi:regulator of replication initiation timing